MVNIIGNPIPILDLNSGGGGGSVNSVTGTGVTGSLADPTINIATFVSGQLNNKVFLSTDVVPPPRFVESTVTEPVRPDWI